MTFRQDEVTLYRIVKRTFDITLSLFCLIVLSPLFIILSILIKLTTRGPIFFIDKRYGKHRKIIGVIKFRTMYSDCRPIEEILTKQEYKEYTKSFKLENDPRTTKLGKLLRKTSLDELPQLLNILVGQMSFIGPRPIVTKEYEILWEEREEIFNVKPGLTGYWAVSGRSSIKDYHQRVDLECYYATHRNLKLDIKIFFKTFIVVITRKGAL